MEQGSLSGRPGHAPGKLWHHTEPDASHLSIAPLGLNKWSAGRCSEYQPKMMTDQSLTKQDKSQVNLRHEIIQQFM